MATVIDALIMTLGLDTKDYDKNRKGASEGLDKFKKQSNVVAKDVAEGGKKMAQGFATIRNEMIALFAVVTAGKGLKNFFTEGVTGMAELSRHAKNLGMSARQLDAWGGAAETVGGSAEGMQASFQAMASGIEEFKLTGESSIMPLFNALRVQITDGKGNLRSYADTMLDVAEGFKRMTPQDALAFGKRFGFDEHFIYLLQKGKVGVAELVAEMERQSGVTQKSVEEAQRAQAAWARLNRQFIGVRNTIFNALEPAIKPLLERLTQWIEKNRDLISSKVTEWATRFINWLPTFITQVSRLADKIDDVVQSFGGWKTVAIVLGGVMALKVLAPVLSLVGALGRLVPLLAASTGGMWALAAAGAAVAGGYVGTKIYDAIADTSLGKGIGRFGAAVMAGLGSDEAFGAEQRENWDELSPAQRKQMTVLYKIMSPAEKADYDKRNPELSRLINGMLSTRPRQAADDHGVSPAKSPEPAPGFADANPVRLMAGVPDYGDASPTKSKIYDSNDELFSSLEQRFKLPEGLMSRMFKQESSNGENLLSKAGAMGPFQFMPATATDLGLQGNDVFDLDHSASAAAKYMAQLLKMFGGNITKAVAAYNAGPGNVRKYGGTPPFAETQAYVASIMQGTRPDNRAARSSASSNSTSTSETKIGSIVVNTKATDGKGIVSDMRQELSRNVLIASANSGLN